MTTTTLLVALAGLAAGAAGAAGCRRHAERVADQPAAASASPRPTTGLAGAGPTSPGQTASVAVRGVDADARSFTSPSGGVQLSYPPGWAPTPTRDFELMLVPQDRQPRQAGAASSSGSSSSGSSSSWPDEFISLDIPDLPAVRIPGFLPMDQIRKGYVNDLRQQCPGARCQNVQPPAMPGAKVAMVHSVWPADRPTHAETALLMTHADRVYILRGRSRIEDEPATRAAFDQVAQSLRWRGK